MKKLATKAVLMLLKLVAYTACGAFVLWVFDLLMKTTTDNLLFAGFKVAVVALILDAGWAWLSSRKKAKAE